MNPCRERSACRTRCGRAVDPYSLSRQGFQEIYLFRRLQPSLPEPSVKRRLGEIPRQSTTVVREDWAVLDLNQQLSRGSAINCAA